MKEESSRKIVGDLAQYELRQATSADAEFIYQLKKETLRDYVEQIWGWDEIFQRRHFAETYDPTVHQIILVGEIAIGDLQVTLGDSEITLEGIFISPVFQDQGIGTAIIEELINRARQHSVPLKLRVFKTNPAKRLYLRLGFKVVDETDTHFVMRYAD